jgi:sulfhydrogenase subunit gamma (sulfur reductase)
VVLANPLIPQICEIEKITQETFDVKTFRIKADGGRPFDFMPGQCAMLSVPKVGEALFSITSSPTVKEFMEFSIKETGTVTRALHEAVEGMRLGVRGPYGNYFPVEEIKGKDLLFIGGGIGLAPLRSLINYCLHYRKDYGKIDIVYGARTSKDLVQRVEIFENWPKAHDTTVYLTIDVGEKGWDGHVGFVPQYVEEIGFSAENRVAITCGPPIMIKFVLQSLERLGFRPEQVITTLEMRMKCGIGKCGRCNIGEKYVCKDGPVFSFAELNELPPEY